MERPKFVPPREGIDLIWEALGLAGLIALIGVALYYYPSLPERIPRHFNAAGEADAYGPKATLFLLPIIGTVLYAGLTILNRHPYLFNFPCEVTPENAGRLYRSGMRMISSLKAVILISFAYISWRAILMALGEAEGLGGYFLPVFLLAVFGPIGYYIYSMLKT